MRERCAAARLPQVAATNRLAQRGPAAAAWGAYMARKGAWGAHHAQELGLRRQDVPLLRGQVAAPQEHHLERDLRARGRVGGAGGRCMGARVWLRCPRERAWHAVVVSAPRCPAAPQPCCRAAAHLLAGLAVLREVHLGKAALQRGRARRSMGKRAWGQHAARTRAGKSRRLTVGVAPIRGPSSRGAAPRRAARAAGTCAAPGAGASPCAGARGARGDAVVRSAARKRARPARARELAAAAAAVAARPAPQPPRGAPAHPCATAGAPRDRICAPTGPRDAPAAAQRRRQPHRCGLRGSARHARPGRHAPGAGEGRFGRTEGAGEGQTGRGAGFGG
jgi:hypothetical protein